MDIFGVKKGLLRGESRKGHVDRRKGEVQRNAERKASDLDIFTTEPHPPLQAGRAQREGLVY